MLESIAFLHGKKWTSMLIKRCYFGNWLRDYSQAVDVGSLKGVNAASIRILVCEFGLDSMLLDTTDWTCLGLGAIFPLVWLRN